MIQLKAKYLKRSFLLRDVSSSIKRLGFPRGSIWTGEGISKLMICETGCLVGFSAGDFASRSLGQWWKHWQLDYEDNRLTSWFVSKHGDSNSATHTLHSLESISLSTTVVIQVCWHIPYHHVITNINHTWPSYWLWLMATSKVVDIPIS